MCSQSMVALFHDGRSAGLPASIGSPEMPGALIGGVIVAAGACTGPEPSTPGESAGGAGRGSLTGAPPGAPGACRGAGAMLPFPTPCVDPAVAGARGSWLIST